MRISAIQNTMQYKKVALDKVVKNNENQQLKQNQPVASPSFKGSDGALGGLGVGLIGGIFLFTLGPLGAVPAILGGIGAMGCGAAGAYLGDKIEEKIK